MSKHNKKRNVGIIYEQLLLSLSKAIVENDETRVRSIKNIINGHFSPGSELYKEFRLFNALIKTHTTSESLASRILEESKNAAREHDAQKLRSEKSLLIKDINHILNDPNFYAQPVSEYRAYATIQTLLNDWRSNSINLGRIVEYEGKVHSMLLTPSKSEKNLQEETDNNVNRLTVKIMNEKFNKKYGAVLNEAQTRIINTYIFENTEYITEEFKSLKENSVNELNEFKKECSNNFLMKKINQVITNIKSLDENKINDDQVAKFLLISKLRDEILEKKDVG